jgi:hypothetical protein
MQGMAQSVDTLSKAMVREVPGAANDCGAIGIKSFRVFEDLLQVHSDLS